MICHIWTRNPTNYSLTCFFCTFHLFSDCLVILSQSMYQTHQIVGCQCFLLLLLLLLPSTFSKAVRFKTLISKELNKCRLIFELCSILQKLCHYHWYYALNNDILRIWFTTFGFWNMQSIGLTTNGKWKNPCHANKNCKISFRSVW